MPHPRTREGGALKNAFTDMNGIYITTNDHNSCIFGGIEEPHTLCGLVHTHRDALGSINVTALVAGGGPAGGLGNGAEDTTREGCGGACLCGCEWVCECVDV